MTPDPTDGRTLRGDRTRDALAQAARRAFARHGRNGASVRDIAADAGVNPALVRYHFGGKDELYRAVIQEAMSGLRERVVGALLDAADRDDAIARAVGAYLDHLQADPDFPRLVARGVLDGDPEVLRITADNIAPLLALGEAVPGFDREAALSVFGASIVPFLYTPLLQRLVGEDPLAAEALAVRRAHVERLVRLLLAAGHPP